MLEVDGGFYIVRELLVWARMDIEGLVVMISARGEDLIFDGSSRPLSLTHLYLYYTTYSHLLSIITKSAGI